ncbi:MAG: hypothetical protein J7L82_02425 [Staphylothermus sp.]|nr:hypothetical protein [Staphylothermus sp.]
MSAYEFYAFTPMELEMKKPMYMQIVEFISSYIREHGSRRGAFKEAARIFYPRLYEENPRYAIKLVYEHFRYARRQIGKRLWNKVFGTSGTGFGTDMITEDIEMNMGYYIENHNGPVKESKFVKDSKANRKLFEFKKLVYAVLQDLIKPKSLLTNYVEKTLNDSRIKEILDREENIWYNGRSYVKINKKQAALLYLVVHRIYTMHHGAGNKPEKLIKKFFEITSYGPRDLEKEIKQLLPVFYDWLLML